MPGRSDPAPRTLSRSAPQARRAALLHAGHDVVPLDRRGVHHGFAVQRRVRPAWPAGLAMRWRAAQPILVPRLVRSELAAVRASLRATLAMFARLRRGAPFQGEVLSRLRAAAAAPFAPAGSTIDVFDAREIEKVHVRPTARGARGVDLWAKLSWIADDETDRSLRIRFSCGAERLAEWIGDTAGMEWGERFCATVFPECAVITAQARLFGELAATLGVEVRCAERIVYANAPGGGAVFHHDAEPTQLGVLYTQLYGSTAWLALPKRELVQALHEHAPRLGSRSRLLRALDQPSPRLWQILNRDPRFTARLVAGGALFVLRAGDAILLPSLGRDDVAWHSVFALGRAPSLAHSYGLFARQAPRRRRSELTLHR